MNNFSLKGFDAFKAEYKLTEEKDKEIEKLKSEYENTNVGGRQFVSLESKQTSKKDEIKLKDPSSVSKTKRLFAFIFGGGLAGAAVGAGAGGAFTVVTGGAGFGAVFIGAAAGFLIGSISAVALLILNKGVNTAKDYISNKFHQTEPDTTPDYQKDFEYDDDDTFGNFYEKV